jgi:hypothetical protein
VSSELLPTLCHQVSWRAIVGCRPQQVEPQDLWGITFLLQGSALIALIALHSVAPVVGGRPPF